MEAATTALFKGYARKFGNIEVFTSRRNIFKNPMMRRLFHEKPIASNWTIWCDDDTHFTRPDWLQRLAMKIEASPKTAMWGWLHLVWNHDPAVLAWIRQAAWFRHRRFRRGRDLDGKTASEFLFATGAFWALRTEIIRQLNWPDPRLTHFCEDFLLGEALRQNRIRIGNFRHGVAINDAPRRNGNAAEFTHL